MRSGGSQNMQIVSELTSMMMHKHYCENDVESVIAQMCDKILWIGTGENEYASGRETVAGIFRRFAGKVPKCIIEDEQYDVIEITPEMYLCSGRMWIRTDPSTGISLRVHQRITTAFQRKTDQFRCCLIHISNPYDDMVEDDEGFPNRIARQSYLYLQKQIEIQKRNIAEQTERLRRMSYEDSLTGLYNRNRFNQVYDAEHCLNLKHLGVAYFDLNGLKEVNDRKGHSAGDALLRRVGECIRKYFEDSGYRIGGDEFVIIDAERDEDEFLATIQALQEDMHKADISYSVGISWRSFRCSVSEQFDEADKLMYQDKHHFYSLKENDRRRR